MSILNPTPPDRLVDAEGRPYFLWDCDLTLADFRRKLTEGDDDDRAYWLGKLMRQAKPDDLFTFARPEQIAALWPRLQRHLGRTLSMWRWLLETWKLLESAGMAVDMVQRAPGFARLNVSAAGESVVVDLVAEPVAHSSEPLAIDTPGGSIQVDSAAEILANKLGCVLHRAELRDLIDAQALLAQGHDLEQAMSAAAEKDGGFSPVILGHLLREFPVARLAARLGTAPGVVVELERFAIELAARIGAMTRPD